MDFSNFDFDEEFLRRSERKFLKNTSENIQISYTKCLTKNLDSIYLFETKHNGFFINGLFDFVEGNDIDKIYFNTLFQAIEDFEHICVGEWNIFKWNYLCNSIMLKIGLYNVDITEFEKPFRNWLYLNRFHVPYFNDGFLESLLHKFSDLFEEHNISSDFLSVYKFAYENCNFEDMKDLLEEVGIYFNSYTKNHAY